MNNPSGLASAANAPDGLGGWLIVSSTWVYTVCIPHLPHCFHNHCRVIRRITELDAFSQTLQSPLYVAMALRTLVVTVSQVWSHREPSAPSARAVMLLLLSSHLPLGTMTALSGPAGVSEFDSAGTFYVSDTMNRVVRRIFQNGTAAIVAGVLGVSGTSAGLLNFPRAISLVGNDVVIADSGQHAVRILYANSTLSSIFGVLGTAAYSGDGGLGEH